MEFGQDKMNKLGPIIPPQPTYFNQDNADMLARRAKDLQFNIALFASQYTNKVQLLVHFLTSRTVEHDRMLAVSYLGQMAPTSQLFQPTPLSVQIEEMKDCGRRVEATVYTNGQQIHRWMDQAGQLIIKGEYRSVHNLLINVRRELRDTEQEVTEACDEWMSQLANLRQTAKQAEPKAFVDYLRQQIGVMACHDALQEHIQNVDQLLLVIACQ